MVVTQCTQGDHTGQISIPSLNPLQRRVVHAIAGVAVVDVGLIAHDLGELVRQLVAPTPGVLVIHTHLGLPRQHSAQLLELSVELTILDVILGRDFGHWICYFAHELLAVPNFDAAMNIDRTNDLVSIRLTAVIKLVVLAAFHSHTICCDAVCFTDALSIEVQIAGCHAQPAVLDAVGEVVEADVGRAVLVALEDA